MASLRLPLALSDAALLSGDLGGRLRGRRRPGRGGGSSEHAVELQTVLKSEVRGNCFLRMLSYRRFCPARMKSQPNIRCADKILTQLEMHAKAELFFGEADNANGQFDQNGGRRRPILQRTSVRSEIVFHFFLANLTGFHFRDLSTPTPTTRRASLAARWSCGAGTAGAAGGGGSGTRAPGRAAATTLPSRPSSRQSATAANTNLRTLTRRSPRRGGGGRRGTRPRGNR